MTTKMKKAQARREELGRKFVAMLPQVRRVAEMAVTDAKCRAAFRLPRFLSGAATALAAVELKLADVLLAADRSRTTKERLAGVVPGRPWGAALRALRSTVGWPLMDGLCAARVLIQGAVADRGAAAYLADHLPALAHLLRRVEKRLAAA